MTQPRPEARRGAWRDLPPVVFSPILSGALEAFFESGYHGASIRELAKRVGVSVQGIYYHHENKESMLFELLDSSISVLLERCRAASLDARSGVEMFENLVECIVCYTATSGKVAHLHSETRSLDAEHRRIYLGKRAEVERLVRDALRRAVEEGGASLGDPVSATRAILGMTQAIPTWYDPDGRTSLDELVTDYLHHARRVAGIGHG